MKGRGYRGDFDFRSGSERTIFVTFLVMLVCYKLFYLPGSILSPFFFFLFSVLDSTRLLPGHIGIPAKTRRVSLISQFLGLRFRRAACVHLF